MMAETFKSQTNFLFRPLNCTVDIIVGLDQFELSIDMPKAQIDINPNVIDEMNNFIQ